MHGFRNQGGQEEMGILLLLQFFMKKVTLTMLEHG